MKLIPRDPSRRVLLGLLAAFLLPAILAILMYYFQKVTPKEYSVTGMDVTKSRILEYVRKNGKAPGKLEDLPMLPSQYDSSLLDGWGREFDYSVDARGLVTLRSLGADKAVGGTGKDEDIVGVFPTRDAQGNWVDVSVGWVKDPRKEKGF